jgi:hypothetical protein
MTWSNRSVTSKCSQFIFNQTHEDYSSERRTNSFDESEQVMRNANEIAAGMLEKDKPISVHDFPLSLQIKFQSLLTITMQL